MRGALCMIGPTVEDVGLRRMPVAVAVASLTAMAGLLAVTTAVLANGDAAAAALTVSRYRAAAQRLASRQLGRKRLEADSGLPSQRDTRAQPAQGRFDRP